MPHPLSLLSLLVPLLLVPAITAITIPPPHSLPPPPHSPPPSPRSTLTPRAAHTLRNDYTLTFSTTTAILPIQIGATALSIWYSSIWQRLNTRPPSPSTPQVFKQPFAYHTKHLKLSFTPQQPASNLAVKSMVMAFVEWIEERVREGGFSGLYEGMVRGPWGSVGVRMEWIGVGAEGGS